MLKNRVRGMLQVSYSLKAGDSRMREQGEFGGGGDKAPVYPLITHCFAQDIL